MLIRPARHDELASVGALTVAAYADLLGEENLGGYERELADAARRAREADVLVALDDDGAILGTVTYVASVDSALAEFEDPEAAGIRMLAVDPRRQGEGIGRALVRACVDRARASGRARVVLHSTEPMTTAQSLYRSMGFVATPEHDEYVETERSGTDVPLRLIAYTLELTGTPRDR